MLGMVRKRRGRERGLFLAVDPIEQSSQHRLIVIQQGQVRHQAELVQVGSDHPVEHIQTLGVFASPPGGAQVAECFDGLGGGGLEHEGGGRDGRGEEWAGD